VVLAVILTGVAVQSDAQSRSALVIGNGGYRKLPNLSNPVNDARDMAATLRKLGFSVSLLTDATLPQMEEAVRKLGVALAGGGGGGAGVFFYAGHGVQSGGANYLIPVDADVQAETELKYKAMNAELVLDTMREVGNGFNLMILDACRDNPFKGTFRSASRGLAVVSAPRGSIVVYSTSPGETAADGAGRNSPFTSALLKRLAEPDAEVSTVIKKVMGDVTAGTGMTQVPWMLSSFAGEFYFSGAKAGAAAAGQPSSSPASAAALSGKTGSLYVTTDPDGADILVNGEKKGKSPLLLEKLPLGTTLTVEARNGNSYAVSEVSLKQSLEELHLALETQKGNLIVRSSEKDMDVYLDGNRLGKLDTGLFRDIPIGKHMIALKGTGLYWEGEVEISVDEVTQTDAKPAAVGSLRYELPSGATGTIEGAGFSKSVSGTGSIENLPIGRYTMKSSGGGYEEKQVGVTVTKGAEVRVEAYGDGSITVATTPTGAKVYLDGTYKGTSPLTLAGVAKGSHIIKVEADGYSPEEKSVDIPGGRVTAASYVLKEKPKATANLVFVDGGTFQMGDAFGDGYGDEKPVHPVTVSSFWLAKYEVTQKEWTEVMGGNPSYFKGDNLPVEEVTWYQVVDYCNRRSLKEGLDPCYFVSGTNVSCDFSKNGYRLPTESEWEYAAKGGNKSRGYKYAGSNDVGSVGWNSDNAGGKTHDMGGKAPNELGLYDMTGNVWEWNWDRYGSYSSSAQTDPRGPSSGSERVLRGGSWGNLAQDVRAANRNRFGPDGWNVTCGFRVARAGR
jgi:formylglycine-generating enzyme required for sulfatase activity